MNLSGASCPQHRMHRPGCALPKEHKDECRDKDGWPARWSDPTYLGDGPWGA